MTTTTPPAPPAAIQFIVRKGKWSFCCAIQSDAQALADLASHAFVSQLTYISLLSAHPIVDVSSRSGDIQVTKRAGVATLTGDFWLIFLPDVDDRRLKCLVVQRASSPPPSTDPPPSLTSPGVETTPPQLESPSSATCTSHDETTEPTGEVSTDSLKEEVGAVSVLTDASLVDEGTPPQEDKSNPAAPSPQAIDTTEWHDLLYVILC
ncbi:hypothetical protein B5M09_002952 [Aphanomyces astaci]|uniref:Uncharacterized protein n=1 Tax=Aphanomyces astaci TaxID=112090 RepID=A0A425D9A1_APHAT|nr:hypothetical protein B5M09_002952 [Aphanomyces astaci]